jgi:uncharacterized protein YdaU (DUF1376 family)
MEDLAYRRILDLYYLNEQPLNGCASDVARDIGLVGNVDEVEYVLNKFFIKDENVFRQKRVDSEIKKYKSNAKNKSKAGKASAKARRNKASSNATGVEQVLDSVEGTLNTKATDEQLNINHKPLTNNHKPLTKLKDKEIVAKAPKFNFKQACLDLGVEQQVLDDWLVTRKKKRSSNTQTSLTMVVNQAELAGIHPAEAIKVAAENNWSSFKAEWYQNSVVSTGHNGRQTLLERNQQSARDFINEQL